MSSTQVVHEEISPALLVDAMLAFRKTAAMKAAIEFDLFTKFGGQARTAAMLASDIDCAERGVRILCDFLVVSGLLTKSGESYAPTPSSKAFLDRRSPAYIGAAIDFMGSPQMMSLFLENPAAYVRNGGSVGLANVEPDNPIWVKFARGMFGLNTASAKAVASDVATWSKLPSKVLDVAAGPGAFGIEIAKVAPSASVVAIDWKPVLAVTEENATNAGVAGRFSFRPGSAFEVDWGSGYDLILLPNFLHHFDAEGCVMLLKKARASLAAGGRVAIVEFVPNEDRVSPEFPAAFAMVMLATTPKGDAYTERELADMAKSAGFQEFVSRPLPPSPASLIFLE